MVADHDHNIWMGTDLGVMKFIRHAETVVGIEAAETQNNQITIYPNPVDDLLQLQGIEKDVTVNVFGADGREVSVFITDQTIDVSELKRGVYCIKIQSDYQVKSEAVY